MPARGGAKRNPWSKVEQLPLRPNGAKQTYGGLSMPQSLARVVLHLTFSTKKRCTWLKEAPLRDDLFAYMAGIQKNLDSPAIIINGVEDHVHSLFSLSRNYAIKDIVRDVKADSSSWLKKQSAALKEFAWQAGYGVFSVSESNVASVRKYIEEQEEHHKTRTFQEEFRLLCERHGIEIDERYVWD
jgi:putative transposase